MDILRMALNDPVAKIRLAQLGLRGAIGRDEASVPFVDWEVLADGRTNESGQLDDTAQHPGE